MGASNKIWAFLDALSTSLNFNFAMPAQRIRVFIGSLAEIIAYNRSFTAQERGFVENYLKRKWGV